MASISIALSKGRIFDETAPLLARVGIRPEADPETSRKLDHRHQPPRRAADRRARQPTRPPTCSTAPPTSASPARDVLAEHGGEGLYQPLDLGIAACRMMVAVRKGFDYAAAVRQGARLRVATKYINTAREHFAAKGVHVDLIRLYGSMELAPLRRPRRRDRRPRRHRQDAEGERPGGGRGDHAGVGAPDRQPGGAQDQARRRCSR